jgi:predicted nucleic acid-binding Zn ribbon protein
MRRSNTQSLSEIIKEYVKANQIERKLKEVDVVESWENLLGKSVANYTRNIYIRNKVLYVEISSSVVKHELFMMREEIKRKINEKEGEEIVRTIIFK